MQLKFILFTLCFLKLTLANAQNIYNNQIGEVKELNIYSKDAKINIGKVIINKTEKVKITLLSSYQIKETTGTFITAFCIGNNDSNTMFSLKLKLVFSAPVDSVDVKGLQVYLGNFPELQEDKLSFYFSSPSIQASYYNKSQLIFIIKSKYKIETTITGIDFIQ
ncbi:hypothetical protein BDD43_2839 [Mucilaginibacter gracilis]|uniref:Uncharacterized protein n=1 Tax=Mucilaginibacter gracilis TaxID=423350 RepID=A0A495J2T0_9SPHI|nr:hypothetical protein [Mucilaginibacter gracilis]RKR82654.1 hypothetical protein BDD43_2839 [Mucilaginibacter gracilis]